MSNLGNSTSTVSNSTSTKSKDKKDVVTGGDMNADGSVDNRPWWVANSAGDTITGGHNRRGSGDGMYSGGGGKKPTPAPKPIDKGRKPKKIIAGGFKDDGAKHMPNDQATLDAIRQWNQTLVARSGRTATDLSARNARRMNAFTGS